VSYWTPPPMYQQGGGDLDPVLFTIGDITVTQTSVIVPHGRYSLRGTVWSVQNQTYVTQSTPSWAIVIAIVGFFFVCIFSLFFLLAKESQVHGTIMVTVQGQDGLRHTTQIPAHNPMTASWVHQQVNHAQALASS
jgi:hypothetical protein